MGNTTGFGSERAVLGLASVIFLRLRGLRPLHRAGGGGGGGDRGRGAHQPGGDVFGLQLLAAGAAQLAPPGAGVHDHEEAHRAGGSGGRGAHQGGGLRGEQQGPEVPGGPWLSAGGGQAEAGACQLGAEGKERLEEPG